MWDKEFRTTLFFIIYQYLFWGWMCVGDIESNWELIRVLPSFETETLDTYVSSIEIFLKDQNQFEEILKSRLANWDKTFAIIKAILYTYLIEIKSITDTIPGLENSNPTSNSEFVELKEKVVGKYIRLAQDYVGGQNVALVHAVISKLES